MKTLHEYTSTHHSGGILENVNTTDTVEGIHQLIEKLKDKKIDGFAIDRYVMLMLYRHLQQTHPGIVQFLKTATVRTELEYGGAPLSYGVLVKDREDYDFLVGFVEDNKNVLNTCNKLLISNLTSDAHEASVTRSIFLVSEVVYWPTFGALMATIGLLFCLGMGYELVRRRREQRRIPFLRNGSHSRTIKRKDNIFM